MSSANNVTKMAIYKHIDAKHGKEITNFKQKN